MVRGVQLAWWHVSRRGLKCSAGNCEKLISAPFALDTAAAMVAAFHLRRAEPAMASSVNGLDGGVSSLLSSKWLPLVADAARGLWEFVRARVGHPWGIILPPHVRGHGSSTP